jgi:FtsH-binding integral membrane protein
MILEPDETRREMDRLYRGMLLVSFSCICVILVIAYFFFPRDGRQPVKSALLFSICMVYSFSVSFWFRSKVKKSSVSGQELYAYWQTKPFSKVVHLILAITVVVELYRAFKKH